MGSTWNWLTAVWGASLRSALEYRAAFLIQAGFMFANNFLFLTFWAIFFERFERFERFEGAGGWGLKDVALLFGVCATSFGLCTVLLGGLTQLATRIEEGRLDNWLLRSRPVWLQAGTARMSISGFGDIASGLVLLLLSGNATPARTTAFVVLTCVSAGSFAAFLTIAHSIAFFASRADTLAGSAVNGLLSFSLYPDVLFGGWSRILLFTLVPAGIISWLPAQLVRQWSWSQAGVLLLGSTLLWALAALVWRIGLSRYESGNLTQAVEL